MTTRYDFHTQQFLTVEIFRNSDYNEEIKGEGYFIIPNPNSEFVSFSKSKKDTCVGDITKDVIPNYTNQQYVDEYGDSLTGMGKTVREFMQQNCRIKIK